MSDQNEVSKKRTDNSRLDVSEERIIKLREKTGHGMMLIKRYIMSYPDVEPTTEILDKYLKLLKKNGHII